MTWMWHDFADKGGKDFWASAHFRDERNEIFDFTNEIDQYIELYGVQLTHRQRRQLHR